MHVGNIFIAGQCANGLNLFQNQEITSPQIYLRWPSWRHSNLCEERRDIVRWIQT